MPSATIVGPGRMGLALGSALLNTEAVTSLTFFGRRPRPPAHPLFTQGGARYVFGVEALARDTSALFLAVPDAAIPEMAFTVAAHGPAPAGCAAFHLSAALPTDVLGPLHEQGYEIGSFHPLQVIDHPVSAAERIPGSYVAVMGSPEALATARRLGSAMGCPLLAVPASRRPLFHAATVLVGDLLPPLLDLAARLMERAGVTSEEALPALVPLVRGVLVSIAERGLDAPFGGPIAKGDTETVALHLRAMDPEDARTYAVFASEVLRLLDADLRKESSREMDHQLGKYR